MACRVMSLGLQGVSGYLVTTEVDLSGGLPNFDIVGLPDTAVKEARDRVRAAIKNCGFSFPVSRITVNLAPWKRRGFALPWHVLRRVLGENKAFFRRYLQVGQNPPIERRHG